MLTYFIESLQKGDQVWKKTNYVAIMILIGRKKKEYIDMFTRNVKNEKKNKLPDDYKFNTYSEWKEYVWLKYNSYDRTKLIDFLHLLKFMKRNIKPVEKLGDMVFAASYGFVIVEFFNIFLKSSTGH